ncbi:CPBP family intramembrane glutamic endopeptidase [Lacticigenium naphthae]|uniref:CPBP family intramembrane glutamic endopeptidase n=1 Tax=Lacticigenium naphthae TaxID=515351 RepID=UPI0003F7E6E6|nr:CPBP family intramembrane glutamic endopeptidase [Lacticigenium naphthae]
MIVIRKLKPMPLWQSIVFFAIPTVIFFFSIYVIMPSLGEAGIAPIINYSLTLMGPVFLLFVSSFVALKIDGYTLNWNTIKMRFRLKPLKKREWIWTIFLSLFMVFGNFILSPTQKWILNTVNFDPPPYLPSTLNPQITLNGIPPEFETTPIVILLVFQLFFLFFNIFGEEFWWRGYILPRQELAHGRYTWIIHGLLWTLFHVFWWWNLLFLLPGALAASFVAQKLENTTIIIVAHLVVNTLGGTLLMLLGS